MNSGSAAEEHGAAEVGHAGRCSGGEAINIGDSHDVGSIETPQTGAVCSTGSAKIETRSRNSETAGARTCRAGIQVLHSRRGSSIVFPEFGAGSPVCCGKIKVPIEH